MFVFDFEFKEFLFQGFEEHRRGATLRLGIHLAEASFTRAVLSPDRKFRREIVFVLFQGR